MGKISFKKKLTRLFGVLLIIFILSHFVPTPFYVMAPGIAQELSPLITVENGYKGQSSGDFMLTAVASQRATVWDYLYIKVAEPLGYELELMEQQLPEGMDMDRYIELMSEMMDESKLQAQAVAFEKAGYQVEINGGGALVVEILKEGSAKGKLQNDDVIIAVNGEKIEMASDAVNIISSKEIGEKIQLTILRDEEKKNITLKTVELKNNPGKASIGIMIRTSNLDYEFPREVKFDTRNIIGPSAGGVFTLEIYNQLVKNDITHGKKIAGTGTINLEGELGEIDGIEQKILAAKKAKADLFILPIENEADARKVSGDLTLVPAENIEQVLDYLAKIKL